MKTAPSNVLGLIRHMAELLDEVSEKNGIDFYHLSVDAIIEANNILERHGETPIERQEA
jgi:hypothetical protein